jgi:hypothetical protein
MYYFNNQEVILIYNNIDTMVGALNFEINPVFY